MTVVAVLTTNGEASLQAAHRRVPDLRALLPERAAAAASPQPLPAAC
jgi:hypothetical protein